MPALSSLRFVAALVVLLHYRDLLGPMPARQRQDIVGCWAKPVTRNT